MLSPDEFTAGTFSHAHPLSLILPRTKHEAAALIGSTRGAPAAILISGQFAFHAFFSADNYSWKGLIVPNVRIEVDETSLFDPDQQATPLGSVIRTAQSLVIRGRAENGSGQIMPVTLHDGLPETDLKAAFSQWQVVIGQGSEKRVLWGARKSNSESV
jgi:hypothetical protein